MDDCKVEETMAAMGLNAPRVTPADIEANIVSEHYFTAFDGTFHAYKGAVYEADEQSLRLLTFCVLILRNGFTVTGESACASPANFDAAIGRQVARDNAFNKIWPLMGYVLKEQLHHQHLPPLAS